MKKIFLLVILSGLFLKDYSQNIFEKKYWFKKGYTNIYTSIIEKNNFYYAVGYTQKANQNLGTIVKIDTIGNIIKAINIGKPNKITGIINAFKLKNNNNMLFSGHSLEYSVGDQDIILIKTDTNLNLKWFKSIGGIYSDGLTTPLSIEELNEKNIIITSSTNSFGIGFPIPGRSDLFVCQLDSNGNMLWSKTLGTIGGEAPFDMTLLSDSSLIIIGGTQVDTTRLGLFPTIIRIDKNGNILFSKIMYYPDNHTSGVLCRILKITSNHIYLLGTMSYDLPPPCYLKRVSILIKIDYWGNILKLKYLKSDNNPCTGSYYSNSSINTCDCTTDLNKIIVNSVYYNSIYNVISEYSSKKAFFEIDTSFNHFNEAIVNTSYNEYYTNFHGSSIRLPQKVFLTTGGGITSTSTFTDLNATINKTDSFLHSCSPTIPLILKEDTLSPFVILSNTYSVTSINQGTVLSWTPTITEGGYDSTICYCPDIPLTIQTSPVTCYTQGSVSVSLANPNHYTYLWSPPVSTTNAATNLSAGNYTLIITDSTGCKKMSVITITANFNLPLSVTGSSLICSGQSNTLSIHGAQSLTWNTGQTDSIIVVQPSVTTTYSAVVVNGVCQDSVYFTVQVLPTPVLSITPASYTLNAGDTVMVQASGASYYSWYPAFGVWSPSSPTTLITPTATTGYCIIGKDSTKTCADTACVQLITEGSCFDVRIPNVFTPNNDNTNDAWGVSFTCPQLVSAFHLKVVDRWGVTLFETDQLNNRWDGRTQSGEPVPTGTYFYTLEYKINNKKEIQKGYMTLMR